MNLFKSKTVLLCASALMSSTVVFGMQKLPAGQTTSPQQRPATVVMHEAAPVVATNAVVTAPRTTYRDLSFVTLPTGQGLYASPAYIITGYNYFSAPVQPAPVRTLQPQVSFVTERPVQAFVQRPSDVVAANPNITVAELSKACTTQNNK